MPSWNAYQVADVTGSLNSVSKMCGAGNVDTFAVEGDTIKNLWTGASMHFGREPGVSVLNTWVKRGAPGRIDFARQAM